jgi:hypothetical protein
MILLIFGIYVMTIGRIQISRHYGLKGKGARVAGAVCIAFSLGFFTLLNVPIMAISNTLGLGQSAAMVLGVIAQFIVLFAILFMLIRIYGNAFAGTPPTEVIYRRGRKQGHLQQERVEAFSSRIDGHWQTLSGRCITVCVLEFVSLYATGVQVYFTTELRRTGR